VFIKLIIASFGIAFSNKNPCANLQPASIDIASCSIVSTPSTQIVLPDAWIALITV